MDSEYSKDKLILGIVAVTFQNVICHLEDCDNKSYDDDGPLYELRVFVFLGCAHLILN